MKMWMEMVTRVLRRYLLKLPSFILHTSPCPRA
jgi:hypothetical protein